MKERSSTWGVHREHWRYLLAERGHDVVALDLRPGFLEYAQTRYTHGHIRFVAGNALECELDERFDLVFANQIIEHVVYPERLIGRLKGLLNAGGKLVVTTPNWHYVRNNLPSFEEIGDPAQFEHLQFTADGDGHFFAYKAGELVNIFTNAGLRNIKSIFFESPFISGHLKLRYLHKLVPLRLLYALDYSALALPLRRLSGSPAYDCGRALMSAWQKNLYYLKDQGAPGSGMREQNCGHCPVCE